MAATAGSVLPSKLANANANGVPGGAYSPQEGSSSSITAPAGVEYSRAAVIADSVALDWKPVRDVSSCVCSTPFSQFSMKVR